MRMISQNGKVDLPYEQIGVQINNLNKKDIIAYPIHVAGESHWTLAKYSTEEKAVKAMEMLRETWINETVEFEDGISHRNIIFKFPQDDEIEV